MMRKRNIELKRLKKHLKPYIKESIGGPLGKLCEATLELIVPLVVASIIDNGITGGDRGHVISMVLVLIALGAVGLGFSIAAQYFSAKAAVGFTTSVRHELYKHIQTLSYSDIDNIGTSTIITRMTTDSSRVQAGLNLALRLLLRSPFVVFGAMIMAFAIDSSAGAVFAITIPLLAIVVFGIMLITMPMYKRVQEGVDKILGKTRANLGGVRVIRAFGMEDSEIAEFVSSNERLTAAQKKAGGISALMNPLTYVIINLGILLLIHTGALKVNSGALTQGEVIALYNYMSQILIELVKMANMIISISKALASASRISSVFDIKPSQSFGKRLDGEIYDIAVEFKNVSLRYSEEADNSLEGISFKVKRGETIGIIGGTGSGKSSLVNLIPRFYDATEGEVLIDGAPAQEYGKGALINKIGIVPQKAVLFSGSIRENLCWRAEGDDEALMRALRIAQAERVVADKGGLDARIEAGGRNFSGGQRQRLTIARALVGSPEILILDDSASALDYATDAALRKSIREGLDNMTVFIVSQRAASVMHADKIIVMDDGRISDIGSHGELLERSAVYREIYDSQFRKEAI